MKFDLYERGGGGGCENLQAMLKGVRKSFRVVFLRKLEVLATEGGRSQKLFNPVLRRGGGVEERRNKFQNGNFSIL